MIITLNDIGLQMTLTFGQTDRLNWNYYLPHARMVIISTQFEYVRNQFSDIDNAEVDS